MFLYKNHFYFTPPGSENQFLGSWVPPVFATLKMIFEPLMQLGKGFVIKSIFFLISFTSLLAEWSPEVSSPQLIGNGIQPQVGATSDGGVYIAWITDGNYHVYIQKMDELGMIRSRQSHYLGRKVISQN